ncbi:conserved hypothetical protein [Halobacteriovorax marinus SJ]|uniref:Uncharacterized protein n=1 Tax=Halobacteriovorax marinus (strain ATCC BAA-682 / DSM 15412 / SJ) TaxID=862908 RepID=E1X474_HALMS|nr:YiiX/YebB-like N1pC/P60 family cysteine hydrolase [Halobacteriovorax marinus]CBW27046.1 conserved hypothetical protein [Halobacteriovorax marinus SJ]
MKGVKLFKILIVFGLLHSVYANKQLLKDIENPDDLYRFSAGAIGKLEVERGNDLQSFIKNRITLETFNYLLKRVDGVSAHLADKLRSSLSNARVINGEEVYQMSTLINIYHGISVKISELNTYAKPRDLDDFLEGEDQLAIGRDLIWLATYSKLYNSFYQNYLNYYMHLNLRKIIKNLFITKENSGQKIEELKVTIAHILEKDNRKTAKKFFKKYMTMRDSLLKFNIDMNYEVQQLIDQIEEDGAVTSILSKDTIKISNFTITDTLANFFGKVTNVISGVFGNLVGKVRWRHGNFYKDNIVKEKLLKELRPLDLLFEKTPFALTDTFIPGHFGHAALYLGTEEQLKEIGLWDSPIIRPYQKNIQNGEIIVEAIRPGVGLTTMEKFLEIDEIAILRQDTIHYDYEEMQQVYKRALDQIGKKYDFNFDVETTDKIVCSELLFFAYGKINWPTVYILGRPTISPDNLAELAFYDNTPINFVLNYWSKKRGTLIEGKIEDLAKNIGFAIDPERSGPHKKAFHKKDYRCKTVFSNSLRSSSRRSRRIQYRQCKTVYERKVYNSAENYRESHNGYFK